MMWLLLSSAPALGEAAGGLPAEGADGVPTAPPPVDGPGGAGRFIENLGQWDGDVRFVAATAFGHAVLGTRGVTYDVATGASSGVRVRLSFASSLGADPVGVVDAGSPTNYLLGTDPAAWAVGARSFSEVVYRDVWPSVDVRYRFSGCELKYDVVLRPGAEASDVAFVVEGHEGLDVGRDAVDVRLPGGAALRDGSLVAWYGDGDAGPLPVRFERRAGGFGFDVEGEPGRTVVIDPMVVHSSTFLGSSYDDEAFDVDVDAEGNVYVLSQVTTSDFPVTPGAYCEEYKDYDLAVTKLNHNCSQLIWSTFLGGTRFEGPCGFDLDDQGHLYIVGDTYSSDFPVTEGCLEPYMNLGKDNVRLDAFLCKLGVDGDRLEYSTFIGGSSAERAGDVRVRDGQAAVVGWTDSKDFPTESGSFASLHGDAFLVVVSGDGSSMVCSNFWGGYEAEMATSLAFDRNGDIVVAGTTSSDDFWSTPDVYQPRKTCFQSAFVSRYCPHTDEVLWSTYCGGAWECGGKIAVDDDLCVYITGFTYWSGPGTTYPTTDGAFDRTYNGRYDAFVTKMDPDGTRLIYSTLLGGDGDDRITAIEVDGEGNAVLVGYTTSGANFTVTEGCLDPVSSGPSEGFIFVLDANGSAPVFSTFVGGGADDALGGVAIDSRDNLVVAGRTSSVDHAVSEDAFQGRVKGGLDVLVAVIGGLSPTSAPLDLVAKGREGHIELTWSPPISDGGYPLRDYLVYKGLSEDSLAYHEAVGLVARYLDNDVSWGVTYYYAVVADNGKGKSPRSNVASAMSVTVPAAPRNLTASATVHGVDLAWEAPLFTGGLPVLEYRVYRGEEGAGTVLLAVTGPEALAFEDLGVGDGRIYTYELACANAFGESRTRSSATVRTHDVPTPPLGLRHTYGDLFIDLAWDAPSRDNGMPVVGYRVYRWTGEGPAQLVGEVASPARSYRDERVEVGVAYRYHATAVNAKGESAPSEPREAMAKVRPGAPGRVTATAEKWAVRVAWSAPTFDGASPVIGYWVYHGTGPDGWANVGGVFVEGRDGVALVFLHDVAYDGVPRRYRVTAFNVEGESDPSAVATTLVFDVPGPPRDPSVAWGDGELALEWGTPLSDGGTAIVSYAVYRKVASEAGFVELVRLPAAVHHLLDDTTANGVGYSYRVTAWNLVGESEPSPVVGAVPAGRPGRPERVAAVGLDAAARLTWEPPASTAGHALAGFRVYGRSDGLLDKLLAEVGPDARELVVEGLVNAEVYLFAVSAFTDAGESELSEVVEATPVGVPSAPNGLVAVWADGCVYLTWSAPASDGGRDLAGYRLHRADRAEGNWTVLGPMDASYSDRDVEPGATYNYTLLAFNVVGDGMSATVTFTVPVPEEVPPRTRETTTWPLLAIGLGLVIAVTAAFAMRRRRGEGT